jgi:hypothetical protein
MSPTRRRRSSSRGGQRPTAAQVRDFWGSDDADDTDSFREAIVEPNRLITPGVDPTALVESLGPLPFPGGGVAQHYFRLVYERAAGLAVALAAAAGLLELSPSGELVDDTEWTEDDAA